MTAPESLNVRMLQDQLDVIAGGLHNLSDAVVQIREQLVRVPALGAPNYATVVADVQHRVLWKLANLNLDGLTALAAEADVARERGSDRADVR